MSSPSRADLLQSLAKQVRRYIASAILFNDQVAASIGLNSTDLQFLNLLEMGLASTPGDLARLSGLTTGGVTVVLDRLAKAGYVKRQPNPEDRRSILVRTVDARMRKFGPLYRSKAERLSAVLSRYDERELQLILDFFAAANGTDQPLDV